MEREKVAPLQLALSGVPSLLGPASEPSHRQG